MGIDAFGRGVFTIGVLLEAFLFASHFGWIDKAIWWDTKVSFEDAVAWRDIRHLEDLKVSDYERWLIHHGVILVSLLVLKVLAKSAMRSYVWLRGRCCVDVRDPDDEDA